MRSKEMEDKEPIWIAQSFDSTSMETKTYYISPESVLMGFLKETVSPSGLLWRITRTKTEYDNCGMKETCLNCGRKTCHLVGVGNQVRHNENNGCWMPTKKKKSN